MPQMFLRTNPRLRLPVPKKRKKRMSGWMRRLSASSPSISKTLNPSSNLTNRLSRSIRLTRSQKWSIRISSTMVITRATITTSSSNRRITLMSKMLVTSSSRFSSTHRQLVIAHTKRLRAMYLHQLRRFLTHLLGMRRKSRSIWADRMSRKICSLGSINNE